MYAIREAEQIIRKLVWSHFFVVLKIAIIPIAAVVNKHAGIGLIPIINPPHKVPLIKTITIITGQTYGGVRAKTNGFINNNNNNKKRNELFEFIETGMGMGNVRHFMNICTKRDESNEWKTSWNTVFSSFLKKKSTNFALTNLSGINPSAEKGHTQKKPSFI